MTFKYGFTFSITGGNKLKRFKEWMSTNLPNLEYSMPPQVPIETEAMTIRLKSLDDRARLVAALPATLP
ncbi:hypothetical protein PRN20_21670 [Devosia sp. ZB163]|jgi:hypothetical protein|uniref:hypothetical protein n=1 Tax=Devosia sp. ZB163 TaxID=3025938 RepID=UPI00235E4B24|nr:hypothetical protein [Devosia sp. ZB163]MDC9826352.1 hypothetical protein [Devosia sp. ZB163]